MTAPVVVPMDPLAVTRAIQEISADARIRAQAAAEPVRSIQERGYDDVLIDLSDPKLTSGGMPFTSGTAFGFTMLRRHSSPGALLLFKNAGIRQWGAGPGDFIPGKFVGDSLTIERASGSATVGRAVLRCWLNPQARFYENPVDELPVEPFALLGSVVSGVVSFVTVAEDLVPSGLVASVTGAFDVTGWSTLQVLIDTLSGSNAASFALDPWYTNSGGAVWFSEGEQQRITFGGSAPASTRYRGCVVQLARTRGGLYFSPRDILPGGNTGMGLCVLGIG